MLIQTMTISDLGKTLTMYGQKDKIMSWNMSVCDRTLLICTELIELDELLPK